MSFVLENPLYQEGIIVVCAVRLLAKVAGIFVGIFEYPIPYPDLPWATTSENPISMRAAAKTSYY